jgi:hypothetical protein
VLFFCYSAANSNRIKADSNIETKYSTSHFLLLLLLLLLPLVEYFVFMLLLLLLLLFLPLFCSPSVLENNFATWAVHKDVNSVRHGATYTNIHIYIIK